MFLCSSACLVIGFIIDMLIGDPHGWPHLVIFYGKLISFFEKLFYDKMDKRLGGVLLVLCMLVISGGCSWLILLLCWKLHWAVYIIVGSIMVWQCLAARSLKDESENVYYELEVNGLEAGRQAVSMIVGRDTEVLSERGVIRAAVETVAENTSDGEIAPMFYIALFGPAGGCLYKAVNTMDSMVGYRNERYADFGTAAARTDDIFNFIPARLAALLMVLAAKLGGFDSEGAWRIFRRDRYKHASPNSAQTESVMAGALNVRLAGDAVYGGVVHRKEYIGDDIRPIEAEDIHRSHRMLMITSLLALAASIVIRLLIWLF